MKRIACAVVLIIVLIAVCSGFSNLQARSVSIVDCDLASSEVYFKLLPGHEYMPGGVNLKVNVVCPANSLVEGFKRIELLRIPETGVTFRVPLTKTLLANQQYDLQVVVEQINTKPLLLEWQNLKVRDTSSDAIFTRNFSPITEPASLRNQISPEAIRNRLQ